MKQKLFSAIMLLISISSALLLALLIFFNKNYSPSNSLPFLRTTIIEKEQAPANWEFELFYSDIDLSSVSKVNYSEDSLLLDNHVLTPYASGFLEQSYFNRLNELVNSHRTNLGLPPINSMFSHHKLSETTIISTSSGLDNLYIIDETNNTVLSPILNSSSALLPQYVYEVIEDQSAYYILTAGVNNLDARLFSLSKESNSLSEVWNLTTDKTALSDMQYALLNSTTGLFTNSHGIQVSNGNLIPLDFTPEFLFNDNLNTACVKITDDKLLVSLIDNLTLSLIKDISFNALSPNLDIIDGLLDNNYLYLFTYDSNHPTYRYYLNIYNLDTNELVLCEALSDYNNLRILDINP